MLDAGSLILNCRPFYVVQMCDLRLLGVYIKITGKLRERERDREQWLESSEWASPSPLHLKAKPMVCTDK